MSRVTVDEMQPRAQAALSSSPIHELRDLRVERNQGSLLIQGSVSSFYHKQLAQEVVRAVCHSVDVPLVNSIRVS